MRTLGTSPSDRLEAEVSAFIEQMDELIVLEQRRNGWFTEENVRKALKSFGDALTEKNLQVWLGKYPESNAKKHKVGLVLAGNIPLVGFHDILVTLVTGHSAMVKLSKDDSRLIPALFSAVPEIKDIQFTDRLTDFDAVIATGSGNTSRYFEHYFSKVPHIIRRNRTSVAVLTGDETLEELDSLADDIFTYFGLGCRNVTKVYMPQDFDLDRLFNAFYKFKELGNHNKYANNYDYHKALWMLNGEDLLENGFLIVKEDVSIVSPVGTLFYERYSDIEALKQMLEGRKDELQCIVGKGFVDFGEAQKPQLWDYADDIDTVEWLLNL
ncbi:MAG: acyl-CoA reductase [Cryomorphaceae bacterium]|nr:acyl-CoA reductase [Cryomorphaceae bacterium]